MKNILDQIQKTLKDELIGKSLNQPTPLLDGLERFLAKFGEETTHNYDLNSIVDTMSKNPLFAYVMANDIIDVNKKKLMVIVDLETNQTLIKHKVVKETFKEFVLFLTNELGVDWELVSNQFGGKVIWNNTNQKIMNSEYHQRIYNTPHYLKSVWNIPQTTYSWNGWSSTKTKVDQIKKIIFAFGLGDKYQVREEWDIRGIDM